MDRPKNSQGINLPDSLNLYELRYLVSELLSMDISPEIKQVIRREMSILQGTNGDDSKIFSNRIQYLREEILYLQNQWRLLEEKDFRIRYEYDEYTYRTNNPHGDSWDENFNYVLNFTKKGKEAFNRLLGLAEKSAELHQYKTGLSLLTVLRSAHLKIVGDTDLEGLWVFDLIDDMNAFEYDLPFILKSLLCDLLKDISVSVTERADQLISWISMRGISACTVSEILLTSEQSEELATAIASAAADFNPEPETRGSYRDHILHPFRELIETAIPFITDTDKATELIIKASPIFPDLPLWYIRVIKTAADPDLVLSVLTCMIRIETFPAWVTASLLADLHETCNKRGGRNREAEMVYESFLEHPVFVKYARLVRLIPYYPWKDALLKSGIKTDTSLSDWIRIFEGELDLAVSLLDKTNYPLSDYPLILILLCALGCSGPLQNLIGQASIELLPHIHADSPSEPDKDRVTAEAVRFPFLYQRLLSSSDLKPDDIEKILHLAGNWIRVRTESECRKNEQTDLNRMCACILLWENAVIACGFEDARNSGSRLVQDITKSHPDFGRSLSDYRCRIDRENS